MINLELSTLIKHLECEFRDNRKQKYQSPYKDSKYYKVYLDTIESGVQEDNIDPVYFLWLEDLYLFHVEYCIYSKVKMKSQAQFKYHFYMSMKYGFNIINYGSKSCTCFKKKSPFILINKAVFIFSQWVIQREWDGADIIGNYLINSLNSEGCIIKNGNKEHHISWFLCLLYSKVSRRHLRINPIFIPSKGEFIIYDEVLEKWDTNDLAEVERLCYLLSDSHTSRALLAKKNIDEKLNKFPELFSSALYLFPYEILAWLAFREREGMSNPENLIHELINTSLVEEVLVSSENSEIELPSCTKVLLKRLKRECF